MFGTHSGRVLPADLQASLDSCPFAPFRPTELWAAASAMASNKTTALARYRIELLRSPPSSQLWDVLALLFNQAVAGSFPSRLNHMLFLPVYKNKGLVTSCDNYRGIALMHPLNRLFSKVLTARL